MPRMATPRDTVDAAVALLPARGIRARGAVFPVSGPSRCRLTSRGRQRLRVAAVARDLAGERCSIGCLSSSGNRLGRRSPCCRPTRARTPTSTCSNRITTVLCDTRSSIIPAASALACGASLLELVREIAPEQVIPMLGTTAAERLLWLAQGPLCRCNASPIGLLRQGLATHGATAYAPEAISDDPRR